MRNGAVCVYFDLAPVGSPVPERLAVSGRVQFGSQSVVDAHVQGVHHHRDLTAVTQQAPTAEPAACLETEVVRDLLGEILRVRSIGGHAKPTSTLPAEPISKARPTAPLMFSAGTIESIRGVRSSGSASCSSSP